MTSYDTYQRHQGRSPDLTPVPLYIAGARKIGGFWELAIRQGPEVQSFRIDRTAILSQERFSAFKTEMNVQREKDLVDGPVVCSVDRKTGTIYTLTPNLVVL